LLACAFSTAPVRGADHFGEIAQVRAVRRADLAQRQPAARTISGSRNESPISMSSPRDVGTSRRFARLRKNEQHRGCVVVDHGGRFCARQFAQKRFDVRIAIATPARRQVEFEIARPAGDARDRLDRLVGKRCSPEICVQNRPGEIEDRPRRGRSRSSSCRAACSTIEDRSISSKRADSATRSVRGAPCGARVCARPTRRIERVDRNAA